MRPIGTCSSLSFAPQMYQHLRPDRAITTPPWAIPFALPIRSAPPRFRTNQPLNDATRVVDRIRSKTLPDCHALVYAQKLLYLRITRGCTDRGSQSFSAAHFIP